MVEGEEKKLNGQKKYKRKTNMREKFSEKEQVRILGVSMWSINLKKMKFVLLMVSKVKLRVSVYKCWISSKVYVQ